MKLKTLKKKIRRLETRLQEGPKKLAKLKRKLEALVTANAAKARRKSAARAAAGRPVAKVSALTSVKPARRKRGSARKGKRKLNLSPERRAQLAAAMKARWAAKRAAETTPSSASSDRDATLENVSQSS
jgi:predicted RNase H-like nuclease (RuvC/YqgF family)